MADIDLTNSGGSTRKITRALMVSTSAGALVTLPIGKLASPVTCAKSSGSSDLTVASSTGVISSAAGIAAAASEQIIGTMTGNDGCVIPFDYTLTGQVIAPAISVAPAVTGTAQAGQTLSCSTGTWLNAPTSYAYQWFWADTVTPISGATSSTYALVTGDIGHTVLCNVTASNAAGSAQQASNITSVVAAAAGGNELLGVNGQSNGLTQANSGATGLPAGWVVTSRVKFWDVTGPSFVNYDPAAQPTWGPEVAYAMEWLANHATGTLYIVKYCVGGTQLGAISIYGQVSSGTSDWAPGTSGGYYSTFVSRMTAAKAALAAASISYTMRDLLWIQCESDSQNSATCTDYAMNESAFYAALRSGPIASTTNIVTHQPSHIHVGYDLPTMTAQQRTVRNADPTHNFIVDVTGMSYQGDGIHLQAASVNDLGKSCYGLTHGGVAPTAVGIGSGGSASVGDPAGTNVALLSCTNRDAAADVVWSIPAGSTKYDISGSNLVVKSGATLVTGTDSVTVRATTASGLYTDATISITIGAPWYDANAVVDLDFATGRYYVNGTQYASLAAMGALWTTSGSWGWVDITGLMPTAATILATGVNAPTAENSSVPNYIVVLDDGADGSTNDEIFGIARGVVSSTNCMFPTVRHTSVVQVDITVTNVPGVTAAGTAVKAAGRIQVNNMNIAANGVAATNDTSCALPNITRLYVGNREGAGTPWGGTISRVTLLNIALTDAQMVTRTT